MGKQYYIALYLIGLKNNLLIDIIERLPLKELKNIFNGNLYEIEFKYNIDLLRYSHIFNDKDKLQEKLESARKILDINKELGIKTILYNEALYPKRLKQIEDSPAIIYLRGKNIVKGDLKSIACVGTRTPSEYGIDAVKSLVTNLSKEEFTIISGLAYGIDKLSHEACLRANGRTIAVVAHGLDMIYPKENEALAIAILKNGGTIISEYPVGTKADKFRFIERNRLVSALSGGVLMIEAKSKSGTKHTIDFALIQKKPIFCPIYPMNNENSLNSFLINNRQATGIKFKSQYGKIVEKMGYKIKYDSATIINMKNESINNVISSLDNKKETITIKQLLKYDSRTGFDVNKEVNEKFKKILKENNLTLKEFYNSIITNVVELYDKGDIK